jgi:hypothetical protein
VAGNTAIIATEGSVILSAGTGAGAVEGVVKGLTNAPPDAPYLISSPFYQTTSDVTNFTTTNIVNYLEFTSNDTKK